MVSYYESCTEKSTFMTNHGLYLGWFVRGDGNFTETADEIELDLRDDGPWLTAKLKNAEGEEGEPQGINLSDHIENQGGELVWVVS